MRSSFTCNSAAFIFSIYTSECPSTTATVELSEGVAVVTGGAMGIGRAIAEAILRSGGKPTLFEFANAQGTDCNGKAGNDTVRELRAQHGLNVVASIKCDVRKTDDLRAAFDLAESKFGKMNILVNNAGICYDNSEDSGNLISINITAVVRGTRLAMKRMSKANGGSGGSVINISSVTNLEPGWESVPVYASSKYFIIRYSQCMGTPLYFNTSGVRVMCVSPGVTDTPLASREMILDAGYSGIFEVLSEKMMKSPMQKADNLGRGVVTVLEKGENGANYFVANDELPVQIHMKLVEGEYLKFG